MTREKQIKATQPQKTVTDFRIDPEIRSMIPEQTPQERVILEVNIKAEGCRDPLVVGQMAVDDGPPVLLDGHNRHEICHAHGIDLKVVELEFASRSAALTWIIGINQLDDVLLMQPVTVAMMITAGGRKFAEAVASHLNQWLEQHRRMARPSAPAGEGADTNISRKAA